MHSISNVLVCHHCFSYHHWRSHVVLSLLNSLFSLTLEKNRWHQIVILSCLPFLHFVLFFSCLPLNKFVFPHNKGQNFQTQKGQFQHLLLSKRQLIKAIHLPIQFELYAFNCLSFFFLYLFTSHQRPNTISKRNPQCGTLYEILVHSKWIPWPINWIFSNFN